LPPDNYYACEVLPEDWIDIIPTQRNAPSRNMTSTHMLWREMSYKSSDSRNESPVTKATNQRSSSRSKFNIQDL